MSRVPLVYFSERHDDVMGIPSKIDLYKAHEANNTWFYTYIRLDTISICSPFDDLTETVFAEKAVLAESYQPQTIFERNEEIEAHNHAL